MHTAQCVRLGTLRCTYLVALAENDQASGVSQLGYPSAQMVVQGEVCLPWWQATAEMAVLAAVGAVGGRAGPSCHCVL
jgi:hypothetical protein